MAKKIKTLLETLRVSSAPTPVTPVVEVVRRLPDGTVKKGLLDSSPVPLMEERPGPTATDGGPEALPIPQVHGKLDLNRAGVPEIEAFFKRRGVQRAKALAEALVQYRGEEGRFVQVQDLLEVPGIGPKTLDKIQGEVLLHTGRKGLEDLFWVLFGKTMERSEMEEKKDRLLSQIEEGLRIKSSYRPCEVGRLYHLPPEEGEEKGRLRLQFDRGTGFSNLAWQLWREPVIQVVDQTGEREIPRDFREACKEAGVVLFDEKWIMRRSLLERLSLYFPEAVTFRAYASGTLCPLADDRAFMEREVLVTTLTTRVKEEVVVAGSDGHGWGHPLLIGKNPIQVRCFGTPTSPGEDGKEAPNPFARFFAKGILIPNEKAVDEKGQPAIFLDTSMAKAVFKGAARALGKENQDRVARGEAPRARRVRVSIGIVNRFRGRCGFASSFENFQWSPEMPETEEALRNLQRERFEELERRGGMDHFVAQARKADPGLDLGIWLAEVLGVEPLAVPYLRSRILDGLAVWNWHTAQGPVEAEGLVIVMDRAIEPGTCAIKPLWRKGELRFQEGDLVAATRIPLVLPQGLLTLKVVSWPEHLLLNGETGKEAIEAVILMNPEDVVEGLFGDSDGDLSAVFWQREMLTLHRNSLEFFGGKGARYLVEPVAAVGERLSRIQTLDPEGQDIIAVGGRGAVGYFTMAQATFLALWGADPEEREWAKWGALAMAVMVQYSIDCQKRIPSWPHPSALMERENWEEVTPGRFMPKKDILKVPSSWLSRAGYVEVRPVANWIRGLLKEHGVEVKGPPSQEFLQWRSDRNEGNGSHRIRSLDSWNHCHREKSEAWSLVHLCSEVGRKLTAAFLKDQVLDVREVDLSEVLLEKLGVQVEFTEKSHVELLRESGFSSFAAKLARVMSKRLDPCQRTTAIAAIEAELHEKLSGVGLNDLIQLWLGEWALANDAEDPQVRAKHVTNAFRLVAWPGSPVFTKLGIAPPLCTFMDAQRLEALISWVERMKVSQDRIVTVVEALRSSTLHEAKTGIPVWECPTCLRRISTSLLAKIRTEQVAEREGVLNVRDLTTRINAILRAKSGEFPDQDFQESWEEWDEETTPCDDPACW